MANYCMMIHVPVFVDGDRTFVASEWRRALVLLRDSLQDTFSHEPRLVFVTQFNCFMHSR